MRFLTRTHLITLLLIALLVGVGAPNALAQGEDVIRDCAQDGDLDRDYSQRELDDAYNNLPSDIDEYSNCRDVIEQARERQGGGANNAAGSGPGPVGAGSSGGGGSGTLGGSRNDNEELAARDRMSKAGDAPEASLRDEGVGAVDGALRTGDESDGLPLSLIVAIVFAALAALAGALYLLRDRLPPAIASRLPGVQKSS